MKQILFSTPMVRVCPFERITKESKAEIEAAIKKLEAMARNAIGAANDSTTPDVGKQAAMADYEAFDTALTALREALERGQGCPVCNGEKRLYGHPGAFPIRLDASRYGNSLEIKVPDYGGAIEFGVEINYCPMCGRKLAKDANVPVNKDNENREK